MRYCGGVCKGVVILKGGNFGGGWYWWVGRGGSTLMFWNLRSKFGAGRLVQFPVIIGGLA